MKQGLQIGFVVIALAITLYMIISPGGGPPAQQGTGPTKVQVMEAVAVVDDYIRNATKGGGLKGRWFVVHGTVKDVTDVAILLETGKDFAVECKLSNVDDLEKVEKGKTIGVAGKGADGALANVPMTDCWLVESAEWEGKTSTTINIP